MVPADGEGGVAIGKRNDTRCGMFLHRKSRELITLQILLAWDTPIHAEHISRLLEVFAGLGTT
jgi:hypothetical protein